MTVLNTIELMEQRVWPFCVAFAAVLIGAIALSIVLNTDREKFVIFGLITVIICLIIMLVALFTAGRFNTPSGKYQYEIIIDDSTPFLR